MLPYIIKLNTCLNCFVMLYARETLAHKDQLNLKSYTLFLSTWLFVVAIIIVFVF